MQKARDAAEEGLEDADEAQSMASCTFSITFFVSFFVLTYVNVILYHSFQSFGVRDKATSSRDRTQVLWDQAQDANRVVLEELEPKLIRGQRDLEEVEAKTKATKGYVEEINK